MGLNVIGLVTLGVLALATIFSIVGIAGTQKGWAKTTINTGVSSFSSFTFKVGTVGACVSFTGFEVCDSWSTFENIPNQGTTTTTSTNPFGNNPTQQAFGDLDKIKAGGGVALAFTVVAFVLLLCAIVMVIFMNFISAGPGFLRNKMICLALVAVACLLLLIAWVVFTALFWTAVKDAAVDLDWKPDYSLILDALAWLFTLIAAVCLWLFKPEDSHTAK